jgi:hypothetical protein
MQRFRTGYVPTGTGALQRLGDAQRHSRMAGWKSCARCLAAAGTQESPAGRAESPKGFAISNTPAG